LEALRDTGRFVPDKAEFMKQLNRPLACHLCQENISNMPRLKLHIKHCRGNRAEAMRIQMIKRRESSF
jgi:hypothetical protein